MSTPSGRLSWRFSRQDLLFAGGKGGDPVGEAVAALLRQLVELEQKLEAAAKADAAGLTEAERRSRVPREEPRLEPLDASERAAMDDAAMDAGGEPPT